MITKSIRRKLLSSVLVPVGIMCLILFYVSAMIVSIVSSITDSYETNAILSDFDILLTQTEKSMEDYMQTRTFEGIDRYYNFANRLESSQINFCEFPNTNQVLINEYNVLKMTESFLIYANNSVSARRANNMTIARRNFEKALQCYGFLRNAVSELNTMYFQRNIYRYNAASEIITTTGRNCIILVSLIFSLNLLLIFMLITNITSPLVEISEVAHRLAARDFDVPLFTIDSHDEIGNICRAFNRMIISIREYIDTIWEKAIQENELKEHEIQMTALYNDAQLKSLQSQINPHFLFNTLNAGAQLAMMEGADKTSHFIEQVADFFRYNIQGINQDATLEDEIRLVDTFIYIMKVRFGSKFEYKKDLKTEKLDIKMPSMILQPLIENCIKHGLSEVSEGGRILLSILEDGNIIDIRISDNGKGFPEDLRKRLLTAGGITEGKGIGLTNVISRLRLYYNNESVFDIQQNVEHTGTVFIIRIPNV